MPDGVLSFYTVKGRTDSETKTFRVFTSHSCPNATRSVSVVTVKTHTSDMTVLHHCNMVWNIFIFLFLLLFIIGPNIWSTVGSHDFLIFYSTTYQNDTIILQCTTLQCTKKMRLNQKKSRLQLSGGWRTWHLTSCHGLHGRCFIRVAHPGAETAARWKGSGSLGWPGCCCWKRQCRCGDVWRRLAGQLVGQLAGQLAAQLAGQRAGQLAGQLAGSAAGPCWRDRR